MKRLAMLAILAFSPPVSAGWDVIVSPRHKLSPGQVAIIYSTQRPPRWSSFEDALASIATSESIGRLELITLHELVAEPVFQAELLRALKSEAPHTLQLAQTPADDSITMPELREALEAAVMATPTIAVMRSHLAQHGLRIIAVECEKPIVTNDAVKSFLWLVVSPAREP